MGKTAKKQPLCNLCGIPEDKINGGICLDCGRSCCTMEDWMWIEQRAYTCAQKLGLLSLGYTFGREEIRCSLERESVARKAPKYLRTAASCDGVTYASLEDIPVNTVLRVCREGKQPDLTVGTLVWRAPVTPGREKFDCLCIVQGPGGYTKSECEEILAGVHFEETVHHVPS